MTFIILEIRTDAMVRIQSYFNQRNTLAQPPHYAGTYIYFDYHKQYLYFEGQLDRRVKIQVNDCLFLLYIIYVDCMFFKR